MIVQNAGELIMGQNPTWVIPELPKLDNGALTEIPSQPHVFGVDRLSLFDTSHRLVKELVGVKVLLAHGVYPRDKARLQFQDGSSIRETVLGYNHDHGAEPIQAVFVCTGDQVPLMSGDEETFTGEFSPDEKIIYPVATDLTVNLSKGTDGVIMSVIQKDPNGFFMNLGQVDGFKI
jgi:hypothetical protein